jgi:hypothetical protein
MDIDPSELDKIKTAQVGITTDVDQHQTWTAQVYPFRRPRQLLTPGGPGTMGFGLPAAIVAALACPERPVVCFSGDGSLLMNIQELVTAGNGIQPPPGDLDRPGRAHRDTHPAAIAERGVDARDGHRRTVPV